MRTGGRILAAYGAFALVVAVVYYVVSPWEWAGTVLLFGMAASCVGLAVYLLVRDRRQRDDDPDGRGGDLGRFTLVTVWPVILAVASLLILTGLIYGSGVWAIGLVAFGLGVIGLVRESV